MWRQFGLQPPLILLHQEAHRIVDLFYLVSMAWDLEGFVPVPIAAQPVLGEANEVV